MEASRKYEQLSQEDRTLIAWMRQERKGVREIAKAVSRSPSTISRELRRNHCAKRGYAARSAHTLSQARRLQARPAPKLASGTWLRFKTLTLLSWQWSPEQASRALNSQQDLDYIAAGLNGRLRLTLGDNCPLYALEALLKHPAQLGATPS